MDNHFYYTYVLTCVYSHLLYPPPPTIYLYLTFNMFNFYLQPPSLSPRNNLFLIDASFIKASFFSFNPKFTSMGTKLSFASETLATLLDNNCPVQYCPSKKIQGQFAISTKTDHLL